MSTPAETAAVQKLCECGESLSENDETCTDCCNHEYDADEGGYCAHGCGQNGYEG